MKREIKFRAWHTRNEVMIDNVQIYDDFNQMIRKENYIIMQYTGLKDCKRTVEFPDGQEIYEGDIIEYDDYSNGATFKQPRRRYVVEMPDNFFENIMLPGNGLSSPINPIVIGNIYENTELITQ